MNYGKYVAENKEKFEAKGMTKVAEDIAKVLANKLFSLNPKKKASEQEDIADSREFAFNRFCALCLHSDVPIPPYESIFYAVHLPSGKNEEREKKDAAIEQEILAKFEGKKGKTADLVKALLKTMRYYSRESDFERIGRERLIAAINSCLVKSGLEPLLPDYTKYSVNYPTSQIASAKNLSVLIFDDYKKGIVNTAVRLAGWPSLSFEFIHYKEDWKNRKSKEEDLQKAAEAIMSRKPDIVLMDQGLGGSFEGSDVVRKIRELFSKKQPVFVANTGGSPNGLNNAGAFGNCNKGERYDSLARAVNMFRK